MYTVISDIYSDVISDSRNIPSKIYYKQLNALIYLIIFSNIFLKNQVLTIISKYIITSDKLYLSDLILFDVNASQCEYLRSLLSQGLSCTYVIFESMAVNAC